MYIRMLIEFILFILIINLIYYFLYRKNNKMPYEIYLLIGKYREFLDESKYSKLSDISLFVSSVIISFCILIVIYLPIKSVLLKLLCALGVLIILVLMFINTLRYIFKKKGLIKKDE